MIKRIFDFTASLLGLILFSPLFLLIGLSIRFYDKGSIFFIQQRVGKGGKLFMLYKFRSMRITEISGEGNFEPGNTSRITKIGEFIRKTKLDELPQLINVLKGDMSIVGPRPEVEKWVAVYSSKWKKVLTVKPGITDNASIVYRHEESLLSESEDPEKTYKEVILPHKLELYEDYVLNHSLFGDLKLIFKTIFHIFKINKSNADSLLKDSSDW